MNYYEVWVRSSRYHGNGGLTYSHPTKLDIGRIVTIPLRSETVSGIIVKQVNKPAMATKEIVSIPDLPRLPKHSLDLMFWLKAYYPSSVGTITQQFLPADITKAKIIGQEEKSVDPDYSSLPELNQDQSLAYKTIKDSNDTYLVHGRTGSGKTRLYMELAKDALKTGRSTILLTPEISLTGQLENQFKSVFGNRVVVLHSTLTQKQRLNRWVQILTSNQPLIVIGPRSALFSPLKRIGLIVIDEEHEPAYKQEQAPYYLTLRVASKARSLCDAKLVLGSATPLISDYYMADQLNKNIIRLSTLASNQNPPKLNKQIVDNKDRTLFDRSQYLSKPLITAIDKALSDGLQSLLYLNRRGTARVVVCETCDWQARCPKCDLPLTYHGDNHSLRCHNCGFIMTAPVSCPQCKQPTVKYISIGTKAVVDEVNRLFPQAKVQRFDADNLKAERIDQQYESVKNGDVDIIIGTQMLAKGFDLPKLSVVGVLMADTSLQIPDYTANERTYQLIQQVIGRVGRGHVDGTAIVQTYQPGNQTIVDALNDNWEHFYNAELQERQSYNFPPFAHLLKLTVQRANSKNAERSAKQLADSLPDNLAIDGPAPAFHEKQAGKYRWQLIVKARQRSQLLAIITDLPAGWSYDIDPIDLI